MCFEHHVYSCRGRVVTCVSSRVCRHVCIVMCVSSRVCSHVGVGARVVVGVVAHETTMHSLTYSCTVSFLLLFFSSFCSGKGAAAHTVQTLATLIFATHPVHGDAVRVGLTHVCCVP